MKSIAILILFVCFLACTNQKNENEINIKTEEIKPINQSSYALDDFIKRLKLKSGNKVLNIGPIRIENLPIEFYSEQQAKVIKMDCTEFPCLIELSSKISNLQALEELHIMKSSLSTLPDEIGKLPNLRVLAIGGGGKLNSVPESIGELENLEALYLWRNNITTLPSSISKLKRLKKLDLTENNISFEERRKIKKSLPNCDIKFEY